MYDERSHLICSTSDDRSVRVWSVASKPLMVKDWRNVSITLRVTIFGHTARVWQSFVLADERVISIGEDSMLCLWGRGGESISQREAHQGGGMWCVDVNEEASLVVTGGADGGVMLWPLDDPVCTHHNLPPPPDTPRRVALLQDASVITVSDGGSLMLYCDQSWTCVFQDTRIASYCLLEVSPSRELIGLATINGHIIVLKSEGFEIVVEKQVAQKRIFSLHWLSDKTILSCHDQGSLFVWNLIKSGLMEAGRCHLPPCKERWTTSAVMFGDTVVYGDRAGNIHSSPVLSEHSNLVDEVHTVRRAHSRLGVSSLSVVHNQVWSTGRDGTLRQFTVCNTDHCLKLVTASQLPFDWVAAVLHAPLLGDSVICFHESRVALWSLRDRRNLLSLRCGGGHRSWSFLVKDGKFIFTYLKDKTAHLLHCPFMSIPRPLLLDGFHIREINSMVHISGGWVASGGEDGTVRLSRFAHAEWTTCAVEHNHLSSVRSVTVAMPNEKTLVFSAGGRAQMKIWRASLNKPASLTEVSSFMLRDERKGRHWLNTLPVSDPETRYMDLHVLSHSQTGVTVLAACSDAHLRVFHFDCTSSVLCLHKSVKNSCYCILRVSSFHCENPRTIIIVSTATDGNVTFWDGETYKVIVEDHAHQSGVNGLSIMTVGKGETESQVIIATGGDDNSIVVSLYNVSAVPSLTVQRRDRWVNSALHSSVITGVEILKDRVICCGGDQRVTVLGWSVSGAKLSMTPLAQHICSVPDVKGFTLLEADRRKLTLSVYGVGMEVVEIEEES